MIKSKRQKKLEKISEELSLAKMHFEDDEELQELSSNN